MKRINFKIIISTENNVHPHDELVMVHEISKNLSTRYGGLTHYKGLGFWCSDADTNRDNYSKLNKEQAYIFECSVIEDLFDPEFIKKSCLPAKLIGAQWIHFEYFETVVNHFDIKNL